MKFTLLRSLVLVTCLAIQSYTHRSFERVPHLVGDEARYPGAALHADRPLVGEVGGRLLLPAMGPVRLARQPRRAHEQPAQQQMSGHHQPRIEY